MITGPSVFLKRLSLELQKFDLPEFVIINPSKNQSHLLKKKCIKIARLDGVSYIKFSLENFSNFLKLRKNITIPSFTNFNKSIYYFDKLLNNYLSRYNTIAINNCEKVVFQSQISKKMHEKFLDYDLDKHTIINNGAKKNFKVKNVISKHHSDYPNIVITSNFRPVKRLKESILLINSLRKKYPKIKLHVIGPIDKLTRKELIDIDCSSVQFYGELNFEQIKEIYKISDIGLSMCFFDACPNSVIEMMASGLPVVTTEISGAFELVDYQSCFGVPENIDYIFTELQTTRKLPQISIKKWSNKIIEILENKVQYENMIKEIFEKKLDIKIIAKKYANLVRK